MWDFASQGFPRAARRGEVPHGLCAVCGAAGRQASGREASQGLWQCRCSRDREGLPRRHVPRGVYGSLCGSGICAPRLSEEIEEGEQDAEDGCGTDQETPARGGADRARRSAMKKKIDYEVGSGNVFADIGLPNANEHLVKAQLVYKISGLMKARGLKQVTAAELFGVKTPDISKMRRGDFRQFSVERLLRFLVALGQDVEIVVTPHQGSRKPPQLRVTDAAAGSAA